jgi:hypothetical protein
MCVHFSRLVVLPRRKESLQGNQCDRILPVLVAEILSADGGLIHEACLIHGEDDRQKFCSFMSQILHLLLRIGLVLTDLVLVHRQFDGVLPIGVA